MSWSTLAENQENGNSAEMFWPGGPGAVTFEGTYNDANLGNGVPLHKEVRFIVANLAGTS